jgi:hypothetical protein
MKQTTSSYRFKGTLGDQMTQLLNALIGEIGAPGRLPADSPVMIAKSEDELNEELKQYWASCLCPPDLAVYFDCQAQWMEGLRLTSNRQWDQAAEVFHYVYALLEHSSISEFGKHAVLMRLEPAAAYLDYLRGDWDKAEEKLFRAINSDDVLENRGAPSIIHLHKVHLVESFGRVERRRGNFRKGIHIYRDVLCYLGGVQKGIEAVSARWGWKGLLLPPGNINQKLATVAGDFASMLAGLDLSEARELFAPLAPMHDALWDRQTVSSGVLAWLRLKRAFLYRKEGELVREAYRFLSDNVLYPKLGCAVALDLLERAIILGADINLAVFRQLGGICGEKKFDAVGALARLQYLRTVCG